MALLGVLVAVSLLGLMAGMAGSSWQTIRQREREADLLWKGGQIRKAIESFYNSSQGGGTANFYPTSLEQLVKDPRSLAPRRHLRRLYPDPMTGEDWVLIKENGRLKGVRSSSSLTPFKQDGFSQENESFTGKASYREWLFVYEAKTSQQTQPVGASPIGPGAGGVNPGSNAPGQPNPGGGADNSP